MSLLKGRGAKPQTGVIRLRFWWKQGEKAELVSGAARNARESLARKMAETTAQSKLLRGLAEAFDLDRDTGGLRFTIAQAQTLLGQ
jgi:excinuclease UvrABC nuclease subunit